MPALNLAALERDGLLSETDYNRVSSKLADALKGLRIPIIRKGLEFSAHDFDKYEVSALENFDRKNAPATDPEFAFDVEATPITLCAKFSLTYFPDFNREYFCPNILDRMIVEYNEDGYMVVPIGNFRSLLLAGHQISAAVKAAWEKTGLADDLDATGLEIETNFMLPTKLIVSDISDEMTVHVTAFVLFD